MKINIIIVYQITITVQSHTPHLFAVLVSPHVFLAVDHLLDGLQRKVLLILDFVFDKNDHRENQ